MNSINFFVAHPVVACAFGYLVAVAIFFAAIVSRAPRAPRAPKDEEDGHGN